MDLIDEKNTGNNFGTAFFAPFGDLLVNLFADLGLDFSDVTGEESHEALASRVDDIDFVEGDRVHNFLALLQFTFGALNETCLGANIIIVG